METASLDALQPACCQWCGIALARRIGPRGVVVRFCDRAACQNAAKRFRRAERRGPLPPCARCGRPLRKAGMPDRLTHYCRDCWGHVARARAGKREVAA